MGWKNIIFGPNELHSTAKFYVNVVNAIAYFVKPNPPTETITNETILAQYSIKQGLKVFGYKSQASVRKELQKFYYCRVV